MRSRWSAASVGVLLAVALLALWHLRTGGAASIPPINSELRGRMKTYMSRLANFGFHGAVLVAREGEILLHEAYGLAQAHTGVRNQNSTLFSTGSVTKQFTAAAILRLEMEGKLSTGDPITRFFEKVPEEKAAITIHHLLTHTAGLRASYGPDEEPISRGELIRVILESPLDSSVGSRYAYSNAGYSMLGAIIEIISGMEYEAFLRERFFLPVGMHHTGLKLLDVDQTLVSRSHNRDIGYPSPLDRPGDYWHLKANGGILSTAMDMYRWHLALQGNEILSEGARKKMFTPYVREYEDAESYYCYGWVNEEFLPGKTMIWHNGGAMPHGWSCAVYHLVEESAVFIVFSNKPMDGMLPVDDIVRNLAYMMLGEPFDMPPEVAAVPEDVLKQYEASYKLPDGGTLHVTVKNGMLHIAPAGQSAINVLFASEYAPLLAKYNDKAREVVQAMGRGDFDLVIRNFDDRMVPAHELASRIRKWWESMDSLGAYRDVEVLGTKMGDGAQTYCRIHFENGTVNCRLTGMGGKLRGLASKSEPLEKALLPQSNTRFAGFSLATGRIVTAEFPEDNLLVVTSGEKKLQARRGR